MNPALEQYFLFLLDNFSFFELLGAGTVLLGEEQTLNKSLLNMMDESSSHQWAIINMMDY